MHLLSLSGLASAFLRHLLRVETLLVLASFALSLLGAVLTFYIRNDHGMRKTPVQCLRYLFPLRVLRLPSCKLDGLFVVAHWFSHVLLLGPLLVFNVAAAVGVDRLLVALFGPPIAAADAAWVHPVIVAVALVLTDFGYYGAHALLHRYPLLWELHKVHHSAEYLIPISRRRLHPVEEVFDSAIVMLFVGSWLGVTAYVFGLPIQDVGIAGVDAYFVLNALTFYHLRHSHIPMSFGWLDRWLISPAQHHVHHSVAPEHLGRNLGTLFAFWDRMFGTWAPSVAYSNLTVGLLPEDQPQDYTSVPRLYWMPLRRTGERLLALLPSRAPQAVPSLSGDGAD